MKELFNKIIQTSTAIVIPCIVVYGIVYAQQVCRDTIVDACIPASDRVSVSYNIDSFYRISPSHDLNSQVLSNISSSDFLADFGAGNTCCETDRCDSYNQPTYFSFSFIQDVYALQKNVRFFEADNGAQTAFEPYNLSISLKAVPIYILTKSIIC
jgi:hypothetical protein